MKKLKKKAPMVTRPICFDDVWENVKKSAKTYDVTPSEMVRMIVRDFYQV